jgi:hypothetical protein
MSKKRACIVATSDERIELQQLPPEMFLEILKTLSVRDVVAQRLLSKHFKTILDEMSFLKVRQLV